MYFQNTSEDNSSKIGKGVDRSYLAFNPQCIFTFSLLMCEFSFQSSFSHFYCVFTHRFLRISSTLMEGDTGYEADARSSWLLLAGCKESVQSGDLGKAGCCRSGVCVKIYSCLECVYVALLFRLLVSVKALLLGLFRLFCAHRSTSPGLSFQASREPKLARACVSARCSWPWASWLRTPQLILGLRGTSRTLFYSRTLTFVFFNRLSSAFPLVTQLFFD